MRRPVNWWRGGERVPALIEAPVRIPVPGGKLIEEYVGRVATADERLSVARMVARGCWTVACSMYGPDRRY
jgi:hypothetical protein